MRDCIASAFCINSGLGVKSWPAKNDDFYRRTCTLEVGQRLSHVVQITNLKTYGRHVSVRAELMDRRAFFSGPNPPVEDRAVWAATYELLDGGNGAGDSITELRSAIEASVRGKERVQISLTYQDSWNPNLLKKFSAGPLVFRLTCKA